MRWFTILLCLLLLSAFAAPAPAAELAGVTEEPIIRGVTLEPTQEPTFSPVTEPITREPTREPTAERTTREVTLPTTEPAPQVGWLSITSTPSGAAVTLDGSSRGVTPVVGIEVSSGSHTVKITMNGYQPYQTSAHVSAGEQAGVDATLVPVVVTPPPTAEPTITIGPIGGDKGWFTVHCNVNGATVTFDGTSGCTISGGSCTKEVSTTGTPYRSFSVQKAGYYSYTGSITSMPGKGQTVDLYATLNPVPTPTYGSVSVTSSPSGAVATLDGLSWQYTPCTFTALTAGTNHEVQVSMSGYQTYTTTVTIPSGQTAYVNANLYPSKKTGSLSVTTSPSGADIYVDGRYIAESPSTVPNLAPGSHSIRLHRSGYNEYVSTVAVYSGQQTPVSVTLSPQSSNVGSIELISTPGGSSVYLDSHYMGITPVNSYMDLTSIAPGYHTVLVQQTDYQDFSQTVYVPAGGSVTVTAVLAQVIPGPTPDGTGQVVIASSPPGAEVLLDNGYKGVTPVTLTNIPAGSHVLTLSLTGYADSVQTIAVNGGQSTPVAVTLVAAAPTQAKSPATVVPVLGAIIIIGALLIGRKRQA